MSFSDFLKELEMDLHTYLLAVRSSICSPKIFLKRLPCETRVNNHNTVALKYWEANMDIQFILDPYACVSYIVSCISKRQRGLSNLLHQACKGARSSESDIRQQVRKIGNQFISHVEIGAQEAVFAICKAANAFKEMHKVCCIHRHKFSRKESCFIIIFYRLTEFTKEFGQH